MRTTVVARQIPLDKPLEAPLMTAEQFERESKYQYAMSIARALQDKGLLTRSEFGRIDTIFAQKFSPVWGALP